MKKVVVFIILILLLNIQVFAASGGGSGDNTLTLETSSPISGAVDISLDPEILLTFSNNVANASVRDNNISSITMVDQDMKVISLNIELHDDQIYPDDKRLVFITPVSPLLPLTQYTIIISSEVTSKNGAQLGEEIKVTFKTLDPNAVAIQEETTTEEATQEITTEVANMPVNTVPATTQPPTTQSTTKVESTTVSSTEAAPTEIASTEPQTTVEETMIEETAIVATTVVETMIAESTELANASSSKNTNSTVSILVILGIVVIAGVGFTLVRKNKK